MNNTKKVIITGADGFIGNRLVRFLKDKNYFVQPALWTRSHCETKDPALFGNSFFFKRLDSKTKWSDVLKGGQTDTIVHLAARAHILKENLKDPWSEYKAVNCLGTQNLAAQAAAHHVRRFIFISTAGVHGAFNKSGPFTEHDMTLPYNYYSMSKLCAEKKLKQIASRTDMEVVIIRPPLVYGPGVKANFKRFLDLIAKGVPLPFKNIGNLRSFIFLDNLADAIETCINHPGAAGKTFLVSDGYNLSTEQLAMKSAFFMGKNLKNFYLPSLFFKTMLNLTRKNGIYDGLWRSFEIDSSKIRKDLGWKPPFDFNTGLEITVKAYLNRQEKSLGYPSPSCKSIR